ncbi:hypothetical protein THIOM_005737 [Candidatus Thiomargarita nelsonii]|uniref:Uncharacterized protein n=1 Tax=Candidatus Thiomargarita nelsonii TaxID=1003181 RepID=A0A176RSD4_9GAMM|nr:hypothetical protein THIOM_005737 [Candidatus Thiomargarita nelsonii]
MMAQLMRLPALRQTLITTYIISLNLIVDQPQLVTEVSKWRVVMSLPFWMPMTYGLTIN